MAARPIDGAEGYRFYQRHDGQVELDEINEHLRGVNLREVKPRMLEHYRKLERHGYATYLTQNRLDLAVAGETGWIEDMQARYSEIAQPVPAEILFEGKTHSALVESLGAATASITSLTIPPAGTPLVLRLTRSGIERTALVTRSDPGSQRLNLRFDLYGSFDVAPATSAFGATIHVDLSEEAETMAAVGDVLLRLERVVARALGDSAEVARVESVSMNSPLELIIIATTSLTGVVALLKGVTATRKQWYEGTKVKWESDGVIIDTEMKRRALQLEVDADLRRKVERLSDATRNDELAARKPQELERPETSEDPADDESQNTGYVLRYEAEERLIEEIRSAGAEGAYQNLDRRDFFAAVLAALALPNVIEAEVLDRRPETRGEAN